MPVRVLSVDLWKEEQLAQQMGDNRKRDMIACESIRGMVIDGNIVGSIVFLENSS